MASSTLSINSDLESFSFSEELASFPFNDPSGPISTEKAGSPSPDIWKKTRVGERRRRRRGLATAMRLFKGLRMLASGVIDSVLLFEEEEDDDDDDDESLHIALILFL